MHILVTNDDGIQAPGLLILAEVIRPLGKVTILAPDRNWSASGHVKTLSRPLRVKEVHLKDGIRSFASDGAPSDCVALALLGYIRGKIDLVVSGINPHPNLGHDLTYSGTVTAAMEAVIGGVPGIAFSTDFPENHGEERDYSLAGQVVFQVVSEVLAHGIPKGVLLNINIPDVPQKQYRGIQVTRQGTRVYRDSLLRRKDPNGHPYYWIGGDPPTGLLEEGTDIGALAAGYTSITPIQLDLTAYHAMQEIENWDWQNIKRCI